MDAKISTTDAAYVVSPNDSLDITLSTADTYVDRNIKFNFGLLKVEVIDIIDSASKCLVFTKNNSAVLGSATLGTMILGE